MFRQLSDGPRGRYAAKVAHDPEHLRAFARRPWAAIEDAKREHIAARYREDPEAHVARVHALREHMRLVRPEWPTPDDRAQDLSDHIALKALIDRASRRLAHR